MAPGRPVGEILVFAKYPEAGRCKTRLAAGLGAAKALAVYRPLLDHFLAMVRACPFTKVLCVDPPERAHDAEDWAPGMDWYLPQGQGDLGASMEDAVAQRLSAGATRMLLLGTDCPQISKESVISSMEDLGRFEKTLNILKFHTLNYLLRDTFLDVDTLDGYLRARHLEPLKRLGKG